MSKTQGTFTVFFDGQFWVGIFENIIDEKLSVCKVTFGAEPKNSEVHDYVLRSYSRLKFSPEVNVSIGAGSKNPKRFQREVKKQMQTVGIGTKSQQALKLQQESMNTVRRNVRKENREKEKQYQFERKQQKKKAKHKGH